MNEAIEKFNKSIEFLKDSNESLLYLLYFNYKILEHVQKDIDDFIDKLKKTQLLKKDFNIILKKINNDNY